MGISGDQNAGGANGDAAALHAGRGIPDTEAVVRFLASPGAHPGRTSAPATVQTIETHMSWVFLVDA